MCGWCDGCGCGVRIGSARYACWYVCTCVGIFCIQLVRVGVFVCNGTNVCMVSSTEMDVKCCVEIEEVKGF